MKLTFWGAAGEVTGSMHLVESRRQAVSCWIAGCTRAGARKPTRKNRNLPFDAASIDAVVLSHAHIDHSGNLPTLVQERLLRPDLRHPGHHRSVQLDAARHGPHPGEGRRVPEQAAREHRNSHHRAWMTDVVTPLYTMEDAERTLPLFRPVPYHVPQNLAPGLTYVPYDAGHILGSSCGGAGRSLRTARACAWPFRATSGRPNLPIIRDPEPMPPADYLIMESTYGGRLHKSVGHVVNKLADVVNRTARSAAAASSCRPSPWAAPSNWCCCCTSWPTRSASPTSPFSWTARWR